jgi:sterol desaturase/sphingolipid hydroxylase (fatty acid hydroxylase superfamily)
MDGAGSVGAIAGAAVLMLVGAGEMLRPRRPGGDATALRWLGNASLYGATFGVGYLIAPLIAALVAAIGPGLRLLDHLASPALRVILAVLILDLLDYALHRASHRFGWLWRLHAVHHSDTELDVTTTLRHHPLEGIPAALVIGGGGALLGFTPNEIAVFAMAVLAVQLIAHGNVALPTRLTALLATVLVTPDFHRLHHSRRRLETDANYGQIFSVWDRLFGTARARDDDAIEFGLDEFCERADQRLDRLLAQPFLLRNTR